MSLKEINRNNYYIVGLTQTDIFALKLESPRIMAHTQEVLIQNGILVLKVDTDWIYRLLDLLDYDYGYVVCTSYNNDSFHRCDGRWVTCKNCNMVYAIACINRNGWFVKCIYCGKCYNDIYYDDYDKAIDKYLRENIPIHVLNIDARGLTWCGKNLLQRNRSEGIIYGKHRIEHILNGKEELYDGRRICVKCVNQIKEPTLDYERLLQKNESQKEEDIRKYWDMIIERNMIIQGLR